VIDRFFRSEITNCIRLLASAVWVLMVCAISAAAQSSVVATGDGTFAGASGLSATNDTDRIAALEQQAFREFRWDVVTSAFVQLAFSGAPQSAASARIMISADGETFQKLNPNTLANEGQVIAVLVAQTSTETDSGLNFSASNWSFELTATPVPPQEDATVGPILLPIDFGEDLGCDTPGCGEESTGNAAPNIAGEPRSEAGSGAASGSSTSSGDSEARELARELQAELARVGCYSIAIDGLWGPGSRKAMTAFNDAKGSSLPVQNASAKALVAVARETDTVCAQ